MEKDFSSQPASPCPDPSDWEAYLAHLSSKILADRPERRVRVLKDLKLKPLSSRQAKVYFDSADYFKSVSLALQTQQALQAECEESLQEE